MSSVDAALTALSHQFANLSDRHIKAVRSVLHESNANERDQVVELTFTGLIGHSHSSTIEVLGQNKVVPLASVFISNGEGAKDVFDPV